MKQKIQWIANANSFFHISKLSIQRILSNLFLFRNKQSELVQISGFADCFYKGDVSYRSNLNGIPVIVW